MKISASPGTCYDTETTGVSTTEDRIVEFGAVRATPDPADSTSPAAWPSFREAALSIRLNPQKPIPPEASKVHGIRDEDVADKPCFSAEVGDRIEKMFQRQGWVGGYNILSFDVPLINQELERVGHPFRIPPERNLDVYVFVNWHLRHLQSRKLEDVCPTLGIDIGKAHGTEADSRASLRVAHELVRRGLVPDDLDEALEQQAVLRTKIEEDWSRYRALLYTSRTGSDLHVGFGKHCGKPLKQVPRDYLQFVLSKFTDIPEEANSAMRKAAGT